MKRAAPRAETLADSASRCASSSPSKWRAAAGPPAGPNKKIAQIPGSRSAACASLLVRRTARGVPSS